VGKSDVKKDDKTVVGYSDACDAVVGNDVVDIVGSGVNNNDSETVVVGNSDACLDGDDEPVVEGENVGVFVGRGLVGREDGPIVVP